MKQIIFTVYLFIAFASANYAQMNKIEFVEYDLDNGLHVILHKDNSTPIVAIGVMYHVGSKNELPNRTGFAHFFEHLMFEGSKYIDRGEYTKYVEKAGGVLNANTTKDRTYYYEILPSNQLDLGLWLESERMLHAKVDTIGINTQREVVKEERRQRYGNQPYGTVFMEIFKRAFSQHPYKWPVIGYMAHLNAANKTDFKNFYDMFYVPNNAVLTIAGDINIEETKAAIKKYFGPIPAGTSDIRRPDVDVSLMQKEIRDTIYDNITLPAVIMAYRAPAMDSKDYYAVDMIASVLSRGESSRMKEKIVHEKQLAINVFNFAYGLEDAGLSIFFGITSLGVNPHDLEVAMNKEIEKIKTELITEREYQKIQNQIEANFVNSNSTMSGIASSLATYYTFYGDTDMINKELQRYKAVTREDIKEAANKYLKKENRVVLYYLPMSEKPSK